VSARTAGARLGLNQVTLAGGPPHHRPRRILGGEQMFTTEGSA
jgi:hypothetical protein